MPLNLENIAGVIRYNEISVRMPPRRVKIHGSGRDSSIDIYRVFFFFSCTWRRDATASLDNSISTSATLFAPNEHPAA